MGLIKSLVVSLLAAGLNLTVHAAPIARVPKINVSGRIGTTRVVLRPMIQVSPGLMPLTPAAFSRGGALITAVHAPPLSLVTHGHQAPSHSAPLQPILTIVSEHADRLSGGKQGQSGGLQDSFYDGTVAPKEDGAAVHTELITPEVQAKSDEFAAAKTILRSAVDRLTPRLTKSVERGDWNGLGTTLDKACCGDAAPKLSFLLRENGFPVDQVSAEFHQYLVYRLGSGQLIVDPTIRQFFGGARAPPGIPKVFVGSIGELHALYERYKDIKTTSYGVDRIYFSNAVIDNGKIESVRSRMKEEGRSPEYEGFRDIPSRAPSRKARRPMIILPSSFVQ